MSAQFQDISLYGGAIAVRLPDHYIDASDLRQVPDNQEVFVDRESANSVLFDITERVEGAVEDNRHITTDLEALKYHVEDIVEKQPPEMTGVSTVTVPHLPPNTPSMTCYVTSPATNDGKHTGMIILLMRLADRNADLLVTLNLPDLSITEDASEGDQTRLSLRLQRARLVIDEIISSFDIKDWELFL